MHLVVLDDTWRGPKLLARWGNVVVLGSDTVELLGQLRQAGVGESADVTLKSRLLRAASPRKHLGVNGQHQFTDRGDRITFDRELVTDDELLSALRHAAATFGGPVELTGDCAVFRERMERVAARHGIAIANPRFQTVAAANVLAFPSVKERRVRAATSRFHFPLTLRRRLAAWLGSR